MAEGAIIRGKYRILEKVGEGGMGEVYKAMHLGFDEPRALKMMSSELMKDPMLVERFKHEAFIARKLQHPNVVRVDDIDEAEDSRPFIVMEFIEGQSLKKVIQTQGPLPVPRVCAIVEQVAAALDAAHRMGMIHRDIKPDNILLIEAPGGAPSSGTPNAPREIAKVLDFGIAKLKEARAGKLASFTFTGSGVVIGTAQYMSPEQAMGKRGDELDGRSDVYSLGVVAYQMLTGALPFKASTTMEMVLAHMQKPPTPISSVRPDLAIPAPIAAVVMKCLEKDRDQRPASAGALAEEIKKWETTTASGHEGTVAGPPAATMPEPTQKAHPREEEPRAGGPASVRSPRPSAAPREPSPFTLPLRGAPVPRAPTPAALSDSPQATSSLPPLKPAVQPGPPRPLVEPPASQPQPVAASASPRPGASARKSVAAAASVVAVLAIGILFYHFSGKQNTVSTPTKEPAAPTVTKEPETQTATKQAAPPGAGSVPAATSPSAPAPLPPPKAQVAKPPADRPQKPDKSAEKIAAALKAKQAEQGARTQALAASLQQFNSLRAARKYDEARGLLSAIGQQGGDAEGLRADLASAASAEFRELQSKRSDADQRRDTQALNSLKGSFEDLARRDAGDPQWANRARDVAENQIPADLEALAPSPKAAAAAPRSPAAPAAKSADVSLMAVGHTPLTSPFDPNKPYLQNFLDPGFRLESKPDLSAVNAPSGTAVVMQLEINPDGYVTKMVKCLSGGPFCPATTHASGWKFSSPTINHRQARAIVGVTVRF